jgi:hypothetical protein
MTVEVQALVPWSSDRGAEQRIVDGISYSRLLLILAVLQRRYGISFHRRDVYIRITEKYLPFEKHGVINVMDLWSVRRRRIRLWVP